MSEGWSTERIAEHFRTEIRARFEAENARHRTEGAESAERCRREHPEKWAALIARAPHYLEISDSPCWQTYCASEVSIDGNRVRIVLPATHAAHMDLLEMFEDTMMAWSTTSVIAELIDGDPRIVIRLFLVDYWDDERADRWTSEQSAA